LPETTLPIKLNITDFKQTKDPEVNMFVDLLKKKNISKTIIEDYISSPYLERMANKITVGQ